MRRRMSLESYQAWRATFPWTDEEIACACDDAAAEAVTDFMAARCLRAANAARAGFVTGRIIRFVLPRLITVCGVCGGKALYRVGNCGRCLTHRLVRNAHVEARRQRCEARQADREAATRQRDARTLSHMALHATRRGR